MGCVVIVFGSRGTQRSIGPGLAIWTTVVAYCGVMLIVYPWPFERFLLMAAVWTALALLAAVAGVRFSRSKVVFFAVSLFAGALAALFYVSLSDPIAVEDPRTLASLLSPIVPVLTAVGALRATREDAQRGARPQGS